MRQTVQWVLLCIRRAVPFNGVDNTAERFNCGQVAVQHLECLAVVGPYSYFELHPSRFAIAAIANRLFKVFR